MGVRRGQSQLAARRRSGTILASHAARLHRFSVDGALSPQVRHFAMLCLCIHLKRASRSDNFSPKGIFGVVDEVNFGNLF